jgi:hypothetical protein
MGDFKSAVKILILHSGDMIWELKKRTCSDIEDYHFLHSVKRRGPFPIYCNS